MSATNASQIWTLVDEGGGQKREVRRVAEHYCMSNKDILPQLRLHLLVRLIHIPVLDRRVLVRRSNNENKLLGSTHNGWRVREEFYVVVECGRDDSRPFNASSVPSFYA